MMSASAVATPSLTDTFLKTADNIGKQLVRDAIWSPEGYCNWQGAAIEVIKGQYGVAQRTFKADLYNGLSGIAIFLAELYKQTQNPIYFKVLNGTIRNILNQHKIAPLPSYFSFFGGQLGIGYMLWRIGTSLEQRSWKEKGLRLLKSLKDKAIQEHEIDVIGGAAGAIPILIGISNIEAIPQLLKIAQKCGDFLIQKAEKKEQGWFWQSIGAADGLTGYSHGAAGISGALLDLFVATGQKQYKTAAMKGFQFEKSHYMPHLKNWPDLRTIPGAPPKATPNCCEMWCHGAPGMILSRYKAYQQTNDNSLWEDLQNAVDTTYNAVTRELQNPQYFNFSLCHGIAGNADILLSLGELVSNTTFTQIAEQVGLKGIELYDNTDTDWPSGVNDPSGKTQGKAPSPGLMLGLAGTGYFYLRLANRNIPSMLLL